MRASQPGRCAPLTTGPVVGKDGAMTETPPEQEEILRTRDLRRRFGRLQAVEGLDMVVREGEIYGFLGVNGAGKTTTIRMLMGITAPDGGEITLFGETSPRTSLAQKRRIGYVSQEQVFYPWMNARSLGRFVGGLYPTWDKAEYRRLLEVLEVPPKRRVSALSGGMRVKLALALALAPRPPLLILDEPTAGLDPVARREFLEIITSQAREHGRTTFFSTHLLDEVERAADRVGIIHQGKIRYEGSLPTLRNRVRRINCPVPLQLPGGFAPWREEASGDNRRHIVASADPPHWDLARWPDGTLVEPLSLEDIFIACVGVSTAKI
ncbi:ABC transporter ATP-binding protein [soil metagenome]